MSKRTTAALAFAGGCLLGALIIGFAWHGPGRTTTWDDIRNWLTALAVIIGVPVALIQLSLQRRQLRDQQYVIKDEIDRNRLHDELLDGQIRELHQRAALTRREQAEAIGLDLRYAPPDVSRQRTPEYMATVQNGSRRLIRDAACRLLPGDHRDTQQAKIVGLFAKEFIRNDGTPIAPQLIDPRPGQHAPIIRSGQTYGFVFNCQPAATTPNPRVIARFTDDAGIHWQIDPDLHLQDLDQRDW